MRRAATYRSALAEFEASTRPLLGTINYYIGPGARTAVSRENIASYRRLAAACAEAWRLLSPDGIVCSCSLHTYEPGVSHLDYCNRSAVA